MRSCMKMMKTVSTNYIALSCFILALCFLTSSTVAAKLTASTSLTVVNVTSYLSGTAPNIPTWDGDWPESPTTDYYPKGQNVYLNDVHFSHNMTWVTSPYITPYPVFPNTINSMVVAIWSDDNGKTFNMQSWDYLRNSTHDRGLHNGMPNCWMGTMIHTVCDRKAGECNGRNKSNVFFQEYPSGYDNCWGTVD